MTTTGTRRAIGVTTAFLAIVGLSISGATAASADDRVSYSGAVPSWATPANDKGVAATDDTVEGEIYLPIRDEAGAQALATAVSTPGARGYRQTLSPAQWIQRFSPTQADLDATVAYLKAQGLTISGVPASRMYVVFRGTPDQLDAAFSTKLHSYAYAGTRLVAPSSAPSLPASVGVKISGVSIDQARLLTKPDSIKQGDIGTTTDPQLFQRKAAAAPVVPTTCSHYVGENTATVPSAYGKTVVGTYNCGYTPSQLRSAYGVDRLVKSGVNGAGQTVAIIDAYASPSIVQDVNTYSAALGEPALTTYSQIVPTPAQFVDKDACQEPSGWQGEQTLDVEAAHGIAPGAKILYVGGFNCGGGLDLALSKILDAKLANIVSNSYGDVGEALPLDVIQGQENLHIQAAAEGVGLYFSSGDNGDEADAESVGYPSPDFPASSPYVTAVGGTSIGVDKAGKLAYETGWGDQLDIITKTSTGALAYTDPLPGSIFAGGAGGGVSAVFAQPAYQKGIVPAALAKGKRVSPDISALADPYTGFLIGIRPITDDDTLTVGDFGNETYGGTSLASPLTAAQIAIVQQSTHSTIGFANPTLYAIDRVLPFAFRDVLPANPPIALAYTSKTSGNSYLVSLDHDTSLTTQRRYDDVTGIGAVSFTLLTLLAQGRH